MKLVLYLLVSIAFIATACQGKTEEETALLALFKKEKQLNCQLTSMKDSITTEWDDINQLLEENLPADMPAEEKKNMLKVRNANLIRMFQSFNEIDTGVQMALKETEELDMAMSKRITAIKKELLEIESRKLLLFKQINQSQGNDAVERLKRVEQSLLSENCE